MWSKTLAFLVAMTLVAVMVLSGQLFQSVDADQIVVIQSPVSGKLTWHVNPGIKWQGFGKVTTYLKRSIYSFTNKIRFNDGAHGDLSGSIQYELPLVPEALTGIHVRFGGQDAVQKQLIQTVVDKSTYMTGPLMSSKESYAEKRNALIWYVEDQVGNGVYRTKQREERTIDPITGVEKTITIVEIMMDKAGRPQRQEEAVLASFEIKPFNFSITNVVYDPQVEQQIATQQQAVMDVQTAMAEAKKAEQRRLTVEAEGQAIAVKAKWDQEAIKAKFVTEAEQRRDIARLDAEAAELTKKQQISLGEGESERKRLVMAADGALQFKLDALVKINEAYAEAIKGYQGNWVPNVVYGGNGGNFQTSGAGAHQLIDLLTAKAAKDLGVDMAVMGADRTKAKQ